MTRGVSCRRIARRYGAAANATLERFGARYPDLLDVEHVESATLAFERREVGFDHPTVGGFVCRRRRMSDVVRRAVQAHHRPLALLTDPVLAVVAAADVVAHAVQDGSPDAMSEAVARLMQVRLPCGPAQWRREIEWAYSVREWLDD